MFALLDDDEGVGVQGLQPKVCCSSRPAFSFLLRSAHSKHHSHLLLVPLQCSLGSLCVDEKPEGGWQLIRGPSKHVVAGR